MLRLDQTSESGVLETVTALPSVASVSGARQGSTGPQGLPAGPAERRAAPSELSAPRLRAREGYAPGAAGDGHPSAVLPGAVCTLRNGRAMACGRVWGVHWGRRAWRPSPAACRHRREPVAIGGREYAANAAMPRHARAAASRTAPGTSATPGAPTAARRVRPSCAMPSWMPACRCLVRLFGYLSRGRSRTDNRGAGAVAMTVCRECGGAVQPALPFPAQVDACDNLFTRDRVPGASDQGPAGLPVPCLFAILGCPSSEWSSCRLSLNGSRFRDCHERFYPIRIPTGAACA